MAVYVDKERNQFRGMIMCHMFADTISELHVMAGKVGLRRSWFQPFSFPHYDVGLGKRAMALRSGAIEVDRREGYQIRKRLRADPAFIEEWKENV